MGRRELVALLSMSSLCLVIVVWLFLAVSWVCLQFVIVVFPDHTHFFKSSRNDPRSGLLQRSGGRLFQSLAVLGKN